MPIKSYIVFPHAGLKQKLSNELTQLSWCHVVPAENKDILVIVTDSSDQKEEDDYLQILNNIESLDHYTLVAGFDEQNESKNS